MDDRFRTEHLFLLVGGNPLPNAVAGGLLATPNATITLVHSAESFNVAQRLRTWLAEHGPTNDVRLTEVKESDPTSIAQGVLEALEERGTRGKVGLNYTGGTKAMSVHAHRAVEHWARQQRTRNKSVETVFSYLSARGLEMVFDPGDPMSGQRSHVHAIGLEEKFELHDLLGLHGWRLRHDPAREPVLPKSAEALATACAGDASFQGWSQWVNGELRAKCRRPDKDDWKTSAALSTITLLPPVDFSLEDFVRSLCWELNSSSGELSLKQAVFADNPQDFCRWLDGKWLEHHVLYVLNGLAPSLHLHECAQNIETWEVQFDVDVIAIRGYQLFALSCSTDSRKGLLKSKLFEAYIRARQLGGDEARVALVCCIDDGDGLQHEMRRDVDPEGRIRVFGRKRLSDLSGHVAEWIQSQCGEEG